MDILPRRWRELCPGLTWQKEGAKKVIYNLFGALFLLSFCIYSMISAMV